MAYRYDVRWKPYIRYIVNTNSARQAEFTEHRSSHTGIESTHQLSKMPRVPSKLQSATNWDWNQTVRMSYTMRRLFLSCRSLSTVSKLMPTAPVLDSAWPACWCMVYIDRCQTDSSSKFLNTYDQFTEVSLSTTWCSSSKQGCVKCRQWVSCEILLWNHFALFLLSVSTVVIAHLITMGYQDFCCIIRYRYH